MPLYNDIAIRYGLKQQKDDDEFPEIKGIRLVESYDKSYALNESGQLIGLSYKNIRLEKVVIDEQDTALEFLYLSHSKKLKEVVFNAVPGSSTLYQR